MTILETLRGRYAEVHERIERAAARAGRDARGICLVAVTKYAGVDDIRELIALGHRDFGENHVQQLVQRASMIAEWQARRRALPGVPVGERVPPDEPVRWHMIGHLQRNKVRKIGEFCRLIQSVDSLRLAEEIQTLALRTERTVDVLLQVNTAGEQTKFGCAVPAAFHLAEQIDTMINVRLRGVMTLAPIAARPEDSRPVFARTRELFEEMARDGVGKGHFNILSMGMTADFEVAIAEGANLVRVGTAIFGEGRPQPEGLSDEDEEG